MGRKIKYAEKLMVTSFSIEPALLEQIKERARQENISKNEIIRKSIIQYLRGEADGGKTQKI